MKTHILRSFFPNCFQVGGNTNVVISFTVLFKHLHWNTYNEKGKTIRIKGWSKWPVWKKPVLHHSLGEMDLKPVEVIVDRANCSP